MIRLSSSSLASQWWLSPSVDDLDGIGFWFGTMVALIAVELVRAACCRGVSADWPLCSTGVLVIERLVSLSWVNVAKVNSLTVGLFGSSRRDVWRGLTIQRLEPLPSSHRHSMALGLYDQPCTIFSRREGGLEWEQPSHFSVLGFSSVWFRPNCGSYGIS